MDDSNKSPQLHPGNAVIASLYSSVVDNNNMPELFTAWDQFIEGVFLKDPEEAKLWQSLLTQHFEQVSTLVVITKPSQAEEKQKFIDRQTFPALIFNSNFRLVAKNEQAHAIWPAKFDTDISSRIMAPFEAQRVLALKDTLEHPEPLLISLDLGDSANSKIVMGVIHPVQFSTADGSAHETLFILRIAKPSWNPQLGRMLSSTYKLTGTELEITQALYQNQSVNTIAETRKRSVRTVRTQLFHIFEKTGASSQIELIGMISNIGQILELGGKSFPKEPESNQNRNENSEFQIRTCTSPEGHILSYAVYGRENGSPVLAIQPTTPPEMTKRFRQAALDSNLRFIVPYKPGSGRSSSRSYRYTPALAAEDFKAILNTENIASAAVFGLYSGGVYALQFAHTFSNMASSVTLVDTGVPLRAPGDFLKMSACARRTFLPARFFPKILLAPHKMVAKDFHSSKAGQKRIVEYFFSGSDSDLELVQKNKEFYNITRDIIRYSFEDISQLVDNVCLWASEWRPLLLDALEHHEVRFLHGENNDVFMWKAIKEFAVGEQKVSATVMADSAQLGVFVHPDRLMNILKNAKR
jgi:DNA-binding CsgD family transcriptional regulator/pimeloyl-ACP methyl ester carboxylesterase